MSDDLAKALAEQAAVHDDVRETLAKAQTRIAGLQEDIEALAASIDNLKRQDALRKTPVYGRPC